MIETLVYRVTGANDLTFRKLDKAIACAGLWLSTFDNVWLTATNHEDVTLHFVRDERGILTVDVTRPFLGTVTLFLGRCEREDSEARVRSALERYDLA